MRLKERPNCPICGQAEGRVIYSCAYNRDPLAAFFKIKLPQYSDEILGTLKNDAYVLEECNTCQGIYQRFVGDDAFQERLYSEWTRAEYTHESQQTHNLRYYLRKAQEVVSILKYFQPMDQKGMSRWSTKDVNILDYGMGWGEYCNMVKGFGCKIWGYEICEAALEHAQNQGLQVVSNLDSNSMKFDVINAEQVFEHLVNPLEMLLKLKQHLTPRGVIRISVPKARRIYANLKRESFQADRHSKHSLFSVFPLGHVNCFGDDSLAVMGRTAGMVPFQIGEGLPIGFKGALKEAIRPLADWLQMRERNVCYYRLPDSAIAKAG